MSTDCRDRYRPDTDQRCKGPPPQDPISLPVSPSLSEEQVPKAVGARTVQTSTSCKGKFPYDSCSQLRSRTMSSTIRGSLSDMSVR